MSLAHYVTLGRSGLRVSPLCLGTMTFGEDWGWGSSVAESEALLATFLERGGNFIDTANAYTKGHSEAIIGDYFAHTGRRDRAVIATKFLSNLYPGDPNGGGAQVDDGGLRAVAAAAQDRLHRPLLDALLGSPHAHRRDHARTRRPGARRQGALRRLLGHAGLEGGAGTDPGDLPRLGWAWASRRGRRCVAACCRANTRGRTPACRRPIAGNASRTSSPSGTT